MDHDYETAPFSSACADLAEAEVWLSSLCAAPGTSSRVKVTGQAQMDQAMFHVNRAIAGLWDYGASARVLGHQHAPGVGLVPSIEVSTKDQDAVQAAQALELSADEVRKSWVSSEEDILPVAPVIKLMSVLPTQFRTRILAEGVALSSSNRPALH